jgi:hypothetical protein
VVRGDNRDVRVWRLLYKQLHGPIRGMVRSSCNNHSCVNPQHLWCEPDRDVPHPAAKILRFCRACGGLFLARTDHVSQGRGWFCRSCPMGTRLAS